jgi:phosphotransferase system IIB component
VLYKIVELASSFSDLQKMTFFGCASRLRFMFASFAKVCLSALEKRRAPHGTNSRGDDFQQSLPPNDNKVPF